jgi:hypothetical protein
MQIRTHLGEDGAVEGGRVVVTVDDGCAGAEDRVGAPEV